jgi:hypothetical protein
MDLIKLQKQLLKEYIGLYPNNFHHSVTISTEIFSNSKESSSITKIHCYSTDIEDVFKPHKSHFLATKKNISLKKVVQEFRELMFPTDNKVEIESDLKSIKP